MEASLHVCRGFHLKSMTSRHAVAYQGVGRIVVMTYYSLNSTLVLPCHHHLIIKVVGLCSEVIAIALRLLQQKSLINDNSCTGTKQPAFGVATIHQSLPNTLVEDSGGHRLAMNKKSVHDSVLLLFCSWFSFIPLLVMLG
jgi:hypothetical protein